MFVKITLNGVSQYVNEDNIRKLQDLKDTYNVVPELDSKGKIKKFSASDIRPAYDKKVSVEALFDIKPVEVEKETISKKSKTLD